MKKTSMFLIAFLAICLIVLNIFAYKERNKDCKDDDKIRKYVYGNIVISGFILIYLIIIFPFSKKHIKSKFSF